MTRAAGGAADRPSSGKIVVRSWRGKDGGLFCPKVGQERKNEKRKNEKRRANGSGTVLKVRLTHQDLANMIFSTREAVSKVMSDFQRGGLIEVRDRRIAITPLLASTSPGATVRN